jgi:ABC-type multidrug transport system ATPase subunit
VATVVSDHNGVVNLRESQHCQQGPSVIEVTNVTKRFYNLVALNDVSLRIPQGEVVAVLGPNGAGKTTLFKVITGILNPDAGYVRPLGTGWPAVSYKPDRLHFPSQMRVREYLTLIGRLSDMNPNQTKKAIDDALARVNLSYAGQKRISELSKGMRQRLGLAQTLLGNAPLILLDEPSNGLDPEGQIEIQNVIKALHADGKTILLSSHQLQEVTDICTRLIILNQGQIRYRNTMVDALATRPHVTIEVDKPLASMAIALQRLHPEIQIGDRHIILDADAIALRRYALTMLLGAGFDIMRVEQQRTTLSEIYSKAIRE